MLACGFSPVRSRRLGAAAAAVRRAGILHRHDGPASVPRAGARLPDGGRFLGEHDPANPLERLDHRGCTPANTARPILTNSSSRAFLTTPNERVTIVLNP